MKSSKKKAIALFVLLVVSYAAHCIFISVLQVRESLGIEAASFLANENGRLVLTTALIIVFYIPLAFFTKKNAQIAGIDWLQNAMKWVLRVITLFASAAILYLIF